MLYDNVSLLNAGNKPIDGYCYYSNVPFGDYTTIREYQEKVLEVLLKLDDICKRHNIKYFLYSGTLLGAVRHKGFIPWDDDVDIIMPREDFIKLKKVCEEEEIAPYVLVDAYKSKDYTFTYARFRKSDTTYILRGEIANNFCSGIYIDVFCYDYLSDNQLVAAIQKRTFKYYHRLVSFGYSQYIYHITYFEEWIIKLLSKLIGKRNLMKTFQKIISCGNKEKASQIIIDLLLPSVNILNVWDKEYYEKQEWVEFEGHILPIPQNSTKLLNELYARPKIKRNCTISEHEYESNGKSIQEQRHFQELQFLPLERSNLRHTRVAFDMTRSSEFYTNYYNQCFDKKKNNHNAIKDSRYRERSAKYAVEMGEVSQEVFLAVQELKTKTFFKNKEEIDKQIKNENYTWFNEKIYSYDVVWQTNIEKNIINYIYEIMLLSAEFEYTLRLKTKRDSLYPELSGDELDQFLNIQMKAWYAMQDGLLDKAEEILSHVGEKWQKALIHDILQMKKNFGRKEYESSVMIAEMLISKNNNLFIALYCKGECLYKLNKCQEAKKYFEEAANSTLFYPFIKDALEYVKLLTLDS